MLTRLQRRVGLHALYNVDASGLKAYFSNQDPLFLYSLFSETCMHIHYGYQLSGILDYFSSIIIADGAKVGKTISITKRSHLRFLVIGSNSCRGTTSLEIRDCPELRSIRIGNNCFQSASKKGNTKNEDCMCSITECNKLVYIDYGSNSFCEFSYLILQKLNSIRTIIIGKGTFENIDRIDMNCKRE